LGLEVFVLTGRPRDDLGQQVRVERAQVVDGLANADGVDRQAILLGGGHQHAAARGAVQLGHDQARDARHILEDLDLLERVLPVGGIEHEDDIVRGLGVEAAQHAADLGQLVHQFALVVQAPGGVDDQHVGALVGRRLDRVEHDRGRVAPSGPVTMGTPRRSAQTLSWPMAAARKVSPAASITE
jgi:hypothetical protein